MSAAAQITDTRTAVVPDLHVVAATHQSVADMQVKEMNRWMVWFGTPLVFMAIFMGATFVTGQIWGIAGVLAALIADICVLIWLCMSSDTNGEISHEFAAAH
jgi:hypothetical protein